MAKCSSLREIADNMAEELGVGKAKAYAALSGALKSISDSAMAGSRITVIGFGSFSKKRRGARMGTNPKTGAKIKIAAKDVLHFKASKAGGSAKPKAAKKAAPKKAKKK